MNKIYEFVETNENIKLLKYLDVFVFFDGDMWMFADTDKDFLSKYIDNIIPIDDFIKLGNKLSDSLNRMNINVSDYDVGKISQYLI